MQITAQLPQADVTVSAAVQLAVRGFRIDLATARDVYLDGERFAVRATTLDAQGEPTGQALRAAILKRVDQAGRITEREVAHEPLATDAKTGQGSASFRIEDAEGGRYLVRVAGTDRFGNAVVAERPLTISGKGDADHLRILADRQEFKVGERAAVNLHGRSGTGPALVTWEADRILSYRIVDLKEGDNPVAWDVTAAEAPDFTLTAARMVGTRFDDARLDVRVLRDLRVEAHPVRPVVGPGEAVEWEIRTTDQLGRPVAAELSLALVDKALLRLHGDPLPPIGRVFYDQTRAGAFADQATNTFRYAPESTPVPDTSIGGGRNASDLAAAAARQIRTRVEANPAGLKPSEEPSPVAKAARKTIVSEQSRRVLAKLDQVIPMPFPAETPLDEVVKYLKAATVDANFPRGIPIFVDPVGLQEHERTMASTVTLDMEDVPLRTSLKYLLKELDLIFRVDDGLLVITSKDAFDEPEGIEVAGPMTGEAAGMGGMGGGQGGGMRGGFGGGMGGMGGGMGAARRAPAPSAPEAPDEAKADDEKKAAPAAEKAPETRPATPPRQEFIETAYWNPSVVTDAAGRARVTFRAPSALADYRLMARGVTGADTLVGQSTADLAVRKDVFVELTRPASLTEGDQPRFAAKLHHRGVAGAARLRLTIAAGGRERVEPKEVELKGDGVEEILFDPFEVPDGAAVRLTLAATVGAAAADSVEVNIPIRPWGVQEYASASGTASDDATAFVGLPPGRDYRSPEMLIVVAPTVRRMLVELALGRDALAAVAPFTACMQPPGGTTADRAADLLGAASVLKALRREPAGSPDAPRLVARVAALVADLVTTQNPDGGWPWVPGGSAAEPPPSDRRTAARATWALGEAKSLGLLTDPKVLDRATAYLAGEYPKVDAGDHETRAALLHALATQGKATFQEANALNRDRLDLPDAALADLALTFARLDRPEPAGEILAVLGPRGHAEPAGPGARPRRYWDGSNGPPAHGIAETTALVALAYAAARPDAPELAEAVDWLLAHRRGDGWQPPAATGPALAALAAFDAGARGAGDRYRLVVTVNDAEVYRAEVAGPAAGKAIRVPGKLLKAGAANAVRFAIEGRGTFGYAVTLTGFARDFAPDQVPAGRPALIRRRAYFAADPELDGKPLPTGFDAVVHPQRFENVVTEIPVGGRARVVIDAERPVFDDQPAWRRDPLILEEHLPAGTTLVEGSVRSPASLVETWGRRPHLLLPPRPPPRADRVRGRRPPPR